LTEGYSSRVSSNSIPERAPPTRKSSLTKASTEHTKKKLLEKPLTLKKFNTLTSHTASLLRSKKEGYLKSKHKYWFVLLESIPLLYYYSKKEDYIKGKSPKGQILLLGCEIEKTNFIKDEPFSFIIFQADGQKFVLCSKTEEELDQWIISVKESRQLSPMFGSGSAPTHEDTIAKLTEKIKKLQRAIRVLLKEKDEKSKLKRPNEGFYKEYFFFLGLSVKRDVGIISESINVHSLYEKAEGDNIPFHEWYKWIPQQMDALLKSSPIQKKISVLASF